MAGDGTVRKWEKELFTPQSMLSLLPCFQCQEWRHRRLTLCSLSHWTSHTPRLQHCKHMLAGSGYLPRAEKFKPDAWELTFTGYHCCGIYIFTASFSSSPRCSPAEFVFKPSVPKYKTKYLRLNLAPKKENIISQYKWYSTSHNDFNRLYFSYIHTSLGSQVLSQQTVQDLGLQDGLISVDVTAVTSYGLQNSH